METSGFSSQAANPHAQGLLHISTSTQVSPAQFESELWSHHYALRPLGVHYHQLVSMFQLGLHSNSPDRGQDTNSACSRLAARVKERKMTQAKSQHVRTIMSYH